MGTFANLSVGKLEDGTAIGACPPLVNRLKVPLQKAKIILLTGGWQRVILIRWQLCPIGGTYNIKNLFDRSRYHGRSTIDPGDLSNRWPICFCHGTCRNQMNNWWLKFGINSGKYYRATDAEALQKIYDEIDKLEKTEIEVTRFYTVYRVIPHLLLKPWQ